MFESLRNSFSLRSLWGVFRFRRAFRSAHPDFMDPVGTLIFCGAQGEGKTLSAVSYVIKLARLYPRSILVTNVAISPDCFPIGYDVREYTGLDDLKNIENGFFGVIYLIDEIHLELNSLESGNVDIDVMTEISQQRKQRKHIVGTSQVYMRMAKPLREQVKNIVLCRCYFGCIQWNKLIDGFRSVEVDGKLKCAVQHRYLWTHSAKLYECYDTYQKMHRYKNEWKGRKRGEIIVRDF